MSRTYSFLCFASLVGLAATLFAPAGRADISNAVTDFSVVSNPNGVWSYLLSGTLFPLSDGFTGMCGGTTIDCAVWSNGLPIPNNMSIARNIGTGPLHPNSTVYIPTNYLNLDPESGSLAVVFTAPSSGFYQFAGQFLGDDLFSNIHPVSVTENGSTSLFASSIGAFGQMDPFDLMLTLNAGDAIAFGVGTGFFGCSFCNLSTGLWVEATTDSNPITIPAPTDFPFSTPPDVPEPEMLPMLGAGIAALVFVRRWKRVSASGRAVL